MNKLSVNLRDLLHQANLSENELARRTGVAQQIINRMLSGENKNPKISTLHPLANYFMVSISQLIGDENLEKNTKVNIEHKGWNEVPMIAWSSFIALSIGDLILQSNEFLLSDVAPSTGLFATRMNDDSMEPKFPEGTVLIFDFNKSPSHGDFALLKVKHDTEMRQVFIKNAISYKKSLNPNHKGYDVCMVSHETVILGALIQSRTNYNLKTAMSFS